MSEALAEKGSQLSTFPLTASTNRMLHHWSNWDSIRAAWRRGRWEISSVKLLTIRWFQAKVLLKVGHRPAGRRGGGGGDFANFYTGRGGSAPSSNPSPFHIPCTFDGQGTIFVYLPLKCSTPLAYPLRNKSLKQEGPLSFSYFRVTFNKLNGQNGGLFETLLRPF